MLQVDIRPYASDALEDAMNLAQVKALNSFTFSDCLNYLNYAWSDIYNRVACIDDGFYCETIRITNRFTKLPKYVANTVMIYSAQSPAGFNRQVYRAAGPDDMSASETYTLKGFDLFVPDAERRPVWLQYVPSAPMLFFTHHNRDPKTYDVGDTDYDVPKVNHIFNMYFLQKSEDSTTWENIANDTVYTANSKIRLVSRKDPTYTIDITDCFKQFEDTVIDYISCDYPYIFATWKKVYDQPVDEYISGFFDSSILDHDKDAFSLEECFNLYNPYAFTGRESNVKYLQCKWNDKTGMGVIVRNYSNDGTYTVEELGFTPDTQLSYPSPVMYRYLVARLADKFSALNESNIMGVQKELLESRQAFEAFLQKDKSSWGRIRNVNGPTIDDYL